MAHASFNKRALHARQGKRQKLKFQMVHSEERKIVAEKEKDTALALYTTDLYLRGQDVVQISAVHCVFVLVCLEYASLPNSMRLLRFKK